MENFAFKNYEEFKQLFPVKVSRDGSTYHQNKILLAFLLSRSVREWCKKNDRMDLLKVSSMVELRAKCMAAVDYNHDHNWWTLGNGWCGMSSHFIEDEYHGLCEDMDITAIRYKNPDNDRIFKKKAGRFFKDVLLETSFGQAIPESVLLWLCEEFQQSWSTFAATRLDANAYTLHVDKDFAAIYSRGRCLGNFGSCMAGEGYYSFYEDAVKCHAAYLTNEDDKIVARCVIYDEVQDMNTGEIFRLAERQYSTDGDIILKRMLVNALITGKYIDGFKTPGADCHSPHSFETIHGEPLTNDFKIECNLDHGDTLSYQDSFKYFKEDLQVAYNDDYYDYDEELTTTSGVYPEAEENYDDYHEEYTRNELQRVYVHGREYWCDEDNLDDFVWVESEREYHHIDDVFRCDRCGEYELLDNTCYSEITEEEYCCEDCRDEAEEEYKKRYWAYSSYDDEYYEDEDEVVPYYKLVRGDNGIDLVEIGTIHTDSIDSDFVEIDGCQILVSKSTLAVA